MIDSHADTNAHTPLFDLRRNMQSLTMSLGLCAMLKRSENKSDDRRERN